VDDDQNYRYALNSILDWKVHGFSIVAEAIHGKHALNILKQQDIDIIITDMNMPQLNGVELIKEVKQVYPHIEIIALSSYDDFAFVKEAMRLGARDYVLKHDMKSEDILRAVNEAKANMPRDYSKYSLNVAQAIRYMEQNYAVNISVYDISSHVNLSPNYLSSIFRDEVGERITEYLNKMRVEQSKTLINEGKLKNYEIAEQVGFESGSYFSSIFKKTTGMTIGEFKNANKTFS
jgi:YesN/AraC family two-component response regulator